LNQPLLSFFCLFFVIGSFSQTEKTIHGVILSEEKKLQNIDIVNTNTKAYSISNNNGEFKISVKANDVLFIISKKYIDRKITITENDIETNNLIIYLSEKPIELEEVKVVKIKPIKITITDGDLDAIKMAKKQSRPVNKSVYTGEIENGIDFIRIGKGIAKLFKNKNKEVITKKPTVVFKDYIKANFDDAFFTKTLKLKPEEIFSFLEFCNADPKSKTALENANSLEIMNFLILKKNEFEKL
jgi:hypothetical protein